MILPSFVLVDIDNCIANDGWRIGLIDWNTKNLFRRYHAYHLLSGADKAGNTELFRREDDHEVILMTSRPTHYRSLTEWWMKQVGCHYRHLLMRNDQDHRASTEIKRDQLHWLYHYGVLREQIACAYDDRPEIVNMYLSMGIKAEVRRLHELSAYHDHASGINHADGSKLQSA